MKYCPRCHAAYPDDSLQFCLEDGDALILAFSGGAKRGADSDEAETIVRQSRIPFNPEQSLETRLGRLQPELKKTNSRTPVILLGLAVCALLGVAAVALIWLLLKISDPDFTVSTNARTNINYSTPLGTPKSTPAVNANANVRPPNRNTNYASNQKNNNNSKIISVGGEAYQACEYFLGSGLYNKWLQMGGKSGRFGCPTMNETEAPSSPRGTTGRYTQFKKGDGGYLIWHGSGKVSGTTFEVSGCMFKLYHNLGGTKSWLGFPVKDGYTTSTGARQDFESGYILWDSKTSVCQAYKN